MNFEFKIKTILYNRRTYLFEKPSLLRSSFFKLELVRQNGFCNTWSLMYHFLCRFASLPLLVFKFVSLPLLVFKLELVQQNGSCNTESLIYHFLCWFVTPLVNHQDLCFYDLLNYRFSCFSGSNSLHYNVNSILPV